MIIERIFQYAIRHAWLIMFLVLGIATIGVWNYQRLPIDAVPDITNVQVQINTEAPGYTPLEAEQRVTFLVETAMSGLPRLSYTRSLSRYGLSQVTVVFEDGTDIYFARQSRVSYRLASSPKWARLRPASARSINTPWIPRLAPGTLTAPR